MKRIENKMDINMNRKGFAFKKRKMYIYMIDFFLMLWVLSFFFLFFFLFYFKFQDRLICDLIDIHDVHNVYMLGNAFLGVLAVSFSA